MNKYILNKSTKILHKLPASESCNTDQIEHEKRYEIDPSEMVVGAIDYRLCRRCFPLQLIS